MNMRAQGKGVCIYPCWIVTEHPTCHQFNWQHRLALWSKTFLKSHKYLIDWLQLWVCVFYFLIIYRLGFSSNTTQLKIHSESVSDKHRCIVDLHPHHFMFYSRKLDARNFCAEFVLSKPTIQTIMVHSAFTFLTMMCQIRSTFSGLNFRLFNCWTRNGKTTSIKHHF